MSVERSRNEVWSLEQDTFLLNSVLRHLAGGSNQKRAFEEAAHEIGRTPGACAFRFNSVLRQRHNEEIRIAKQKINKLSEGTIIPLQQFINKNESVKNLNWEQVLSFLNAHILEENLMEQRYIDIQKQLNDTLEENRILKLELEYFKEVRKKIELFGVNINKMMDIFNQPL
ncbi:hypothetical protein [Paenibacillus andongensis]|uniref:hypothetical protein n=1 Tax=Paenibacillus andongensis TaxID=2975482 RepID=UPI0021BA778C|nr:hypothetical protein [Paenibacillus andongensis]